MSFNIQPVRPLKRRADDDDVYNLPTRPAKRRADGGDLYHQPNKQQRMDCDMDDSSDSTSTMDVDDVGSSTDHKSDYQMSTPKPECLQKYYYGPGLIAFPHSLELFNRPNTNWYWNATSALSTRTLDPVECNQILTHFHSRSGWSPSPGPLPTIQLGTSEDMISRSTPRFSTFITFPSIDPSIVRSETFLRLWTDGVMIPSLLHAARKREGHSYAVPQYARSYKNIKLASECQRIVSSHSVPDTPVSVKVRADELGELWQAMQSIVRSEPSLWEFQDMFLVVVAGQDSETGMQCYGSDLRSFWGHFSIKFNRAVNMEFVDADAVTISPKVYYSGLNNVD
ncbi:hypothetical protein LTR09_007646 [Extremus antarcticus]|uniref:Uncharacterized protein n=1 Tax=Extremus antarcticus TaxID=702011 RepID=A0AAJ0GB05_9PEZI|nr:hypothetical protein LTR09_007646 [Extremus antarcticus]